MAKTEKYASPYNIEMVSDGERQYIVQYIDEADKAVEIEKRKAIFAKRPVFDDYRATPFFETRSKNFVVKLWNIKTGAEFLTCLAKNSSLSMSSHFRYRDVIDIINVKKQTLVFTESELKFMEQIQKSLQLNNVIVPKITAIYNMVYKNSDDDTAD